MRDSLVPVAVALLCIVGIGLGAAAITDSFGGDGGSSGSPTAGSQSPGGDTANTNESGAGGNPLLGEGGQQDDECVAGYNQSDLTVVAVLFALIVSVLGAIHRREVMAGVAAFPIVFFPAMFLVILTTALYSCSIPDGGVAQAAANVSTDTVTDAVSGTGGESDDPVQRVRLAGIFVAVLGALAVLGLYLRDRKRRLEEKETFDEPEVADEVIAAAGDAADEIAQVPDSENAVYRAWARMTEPLDVERPEASTPGEFADAALAAGLDADDVDELTELFEQVRYGTTPITDDHERRARATLRRIEQSGAAQGVAEDDGPAQDSRPADVSGGDSQ